MRTVFIEISGGVVTGAFTNTGSVNVIIIDYDNGEGSENPTMILQLDGSYEPAECDEWTATSDERAEEIINELTN